MALAAAALADWLREPSRMATVRDAAVLVAGASNVVDVAEWVRFRWTRLLAPPARGPSAPNPDASEMSNMNHPSERDRDEDRPHDEERLHGEGEPVPPEAPPHDLVWDEVRDLSDEPVRFDPDSEAGFESLDPESEPTAPEGAPAREGERRDRGDRDRERRGRRRPMGATDVEELGASSGIDVLELPSERRPRKAGALEPGLTLKDLLPFLRPPRTVLVLGATTGNGHNRSAAALVEAFKGLDRNLIVRDADLIDLLDKSYRPAFVRALLEDYARHPSSFGNPFETVEADGEATPSTDLDEVLARGFADRFEQIAVERRPDFLVCTHWLPFKSLERLKTAGRLTAPVSAVIPDPDLCERWISPVVSSWFVANDTVKARLQKRGVDAADIVVIGVPVAPAFAAGFDREQVARELGLRPQIPVVLLRPGGIGSTERILAVAKSLLEANAPINLLVVAGKNDRLREEVEKLEAQKGSSIKAFGFVDNIRDLMGVAYLLIFRATPLTVAEAQAARLPMVILRPSPGLEDRVADRMVARGCAVKAYSEEDLDLAVKDLVRNRRSLQEMQEAAAKGTRADAALVAVDRISRLVR